MPDRPITRVNMPPIPKNMHTLPDGREIAIRLKPRGDIYRVEFPDPLNPKKYKEATTGKRSENEAWIAAGQIVLAAYTDAGLKPTARTITWDQVLEELAKHGGSQSVTLEQNTLDMYLYAVNALRRTVTTQGPRDITPEIARRFATLYAATPYTRSKKEGAKQYTRTPKTVDNAIHVLSCLYSAIIKMKYGTTNPFTDCPRPVLDPHIVTIPTEEDFANFFDWVDAKNWEVMSVFIKVKSLMGCRTEDLCQVRSWQFDAKGNMLTITPSQDKTKKTRTFPIPIKLSKRLDAIRGKTYLWEQYTESIREHTHDPRAATEFTPDRFHFAVRRLFSSYADAFPDRPVKAHDLRRRAITLTVKLCGSVDAAAEALGLTAATVRKHYLDNKKGFDTLELQKRMARVLLK